MTINFDSAINWENFPKMSQDPEFLEIMDHLKYGGEQRSTIAHRVRKYLQNGHPIHGLTAHQMKVFLAIRLNTTGHYHASLDLTYYDLWCLCDDLLQAGVLDDLETQVCQVLRDIDYYDEYDSYD